MHKVMFISRMWSCVCSALALVICSTLYHVSNATQAALVGTVYCDACYNRELFGSIHFISGALVAVECDGDGIQSRFREEVKTDGKGEFKVKLPFSAIKHVNVIKGCSVNLTSSGESECAVAITTASTPIRLKMKTPEYHVFSAGFFTFRPLVQPRQCHTKTRNQNSNDEFSASAPSPSPSPFGQMLNPPMDLSPVTSPIPPVRDRQITKELYHLADEDNFGFPYLQHQYLPPPVEPSLQFQSPPESISNPRFKSPPDSTFNPGLQPPPDSMFNLGLQPPPDTMLNPGFLPPPDSISSPGFQPPSDSMINPGFRPPADSMFNPGFQPPPDSMSNPGLQLPPDSSTSNPALQPPPASIFNPDFQPPPDSIIGPSQTSPPTSTPQVSTPPPSGSFSPLEPQSNSTQSPPSVSLPPFPFLPGSGMPGKPPATSSTNMMKTSSP